MTVRVWCVSCDAFGRMLGRFFARISKSTDTAVTITSIIIIITIITIVITITITISTLGTS